MINYFEYLNDIGIDQNSPTGERIKSIIDYYGTLYDNNELKDIFISEVTQKDGNRTYTSLWLIYNNRICEAKNFLTEFDLDSVFYSLDDIRYWNLKFKDIININEPKNSDRAYLSISMKQSETSAEFQASQLNCKYLVNIFNKYFKK